MDALYVTQDGRLVVLEAKLWRNPEARRKVVAQILDYAKELAGWSYEDLQREVSRATGRKGNALYEIVSQTWPDLHEAQFVDGVARSLERGRFLLLIVGDGIREGVGAITSFLESTGTLEFTFGLVELALFNAGEAGLLVQPRVLAKTEIISRSVVSIQRGTVTVEEDVGEKSEGEGLTEGRQWSLDFWTEWLAALKLDDPTQPLPKPARIGFVYFSMPPSGSTSWLTVYSNRTSKCAGVALSWAKSSFADKCFEALSADREAVEDELGIDVTWQREGEQKYCIDVHRDFPDIQTAACRAEALKYLTDVVNRFVNTFRPRLDRLARES